MRQDGFISICEAARMTGHTMTTLYKRIERGTLRGRRSGMFHFVELESLFAAYPHIKPPEAEDPSSSTEAT
jgi:hypothetical protein